MKLNKNKRLALLAMFVILIVILAAVLLFTGKTSSKKEKIGFIMTGSIGEEGWNGMHYEGVSAACSNLEVELLVKENIKEFKGECTPAIEDLVKQGCKMIILSSYGYAEEVKDTIEKYPEVSFYNNSFEYHAEAPFVLYSLFFPETLYFYLFLFPICAQNHKHNYSYKQLYNYMISCILGFPHL